MREVLVAEVRSDREPRSAQKARSSENFSLAEVPEDADALLWRTGPGTEQIRFSVMVDVRANYDRRVLSNIVSGAKTRMPMERKSLSRRGFYIAEPSGATQDFIVQVYALVPE